MLPLFLIIRSAEPWSPGTILGAGVLISVGTLAALYLRARNR